MQRIETGNYYYGARYYDPKISVWLSVDPLAHKYPSLSPYNFTENNPIMLLDPDGRSSNPIYDLDGNFLGTDDQGLQGEALVMLPEDFSQGMSHAEAKDKNLGLSALHLDNNGDFQEGSGGLDYDRLAEHNNGLSDRPDYDGVVTLEEAQEWRKSGNGEPLFVDFSKFKFTSSSLDVGDIGESGEQYVNFFSSFNIHSGDDNVIWRPASDETLSDVYGTVKIKLLNRDNGTVIIPPFNNAGHFDIYNFRGWRKLLRGSGDDFGFIGYGKGKINLK